MKTYIIFFITNENLFSKYKQHILIYLLNGWLLKVNSNREKQMLTKFFILFRIVCVYISINYKEKYEMHFVVTH